MNVAFACLQVCTNLNSVQLEKKLSNTNEDIIKPRCVHKYNQNIGDVDNVDRQLSITETVRKTMKWYRILTSRYHNFAPCDWQRWRQGTSRRCRLCSLRKTVRRTIHICPSCDTSL